MNADAFRHFYNYHFAENRKIWGRYITPLSHEKFTQKVDYSHGSVRDQIVHLLDAEDMWFSEMRGVNPSEPIPQADFDDRETIRAHWNSVEQKTREYLAALQDDMLFTKPINEPEEDQVLFCVASAPACGESCYRSSRPDPPNTQ